jgi:hypothetical protein
VRSSFLSLSLKNRETFKQGQKVHHFLACTSSHCTWPFLCKIYSFWDRSHSCSVWPYKARRKNRRNISKSSKPDLKIAQTDRSDTQSYHGENLPNNELQEAFRLTEKKKTIITWSGKKKTWKRVMMRLFSSQH